MIRHLTLLLFFLCAPAAWAANIHCGPSDTGNGSGSDWNNQMELPTTTGFVRGNTYYLADGSYGSRVFSEPVSGSTYVTIKKATESDHGTETGWSSAYGDGSAVFSAKTFSTSYWVFDGVTGGGPGNWEGGVTDFGIKSVTSTKNVTFGSGVSNVTIKHISATNTGGRDTGDNSDDIIYAASAISDINISYCWLHDVERTVFLTRGASDIVVEYNLIGPNGPNGNGIHKEAWSASTDDNITIRYNIFEDISNTGIIALVNGSGTANAWEIYGNVFVKTGDVTNVSISGWLYTKYASPTYIVATNWKVYHNTIVGQTGLNSGIQIGSGSGNVAQNNLFYLNTTTSLSMSNVTPSYNWYYANTINRNDSNDQTGTANPFVDWENGDYSLTGATDAGVALGSPYNVDMFGNTRGSDGTSDRGAIEYTSGSDTTAPTVATVTVATNGTTVTIAFSESVTQGSGYNDSDLDLDGSVGGNGITLTYVSGSGTSSHVYTAGTTIQSGETVDFDFNGDANSLEDAAGNDLAAVVSKSVVNNSTQTPSTTTITVTASDSTATEASTTTGTWAVAMSASDTIAAIGFTISGTGVVAGDYSLSTPTSGAVLSGTHPTYAVAATAIDAFNLVLTPVDDGDNESDEVVTITINAGSGYSVGSPSTANITIVDDDSPENQAATPVFSPTVQNQWPTVDFSLSTTTPGAAIYYTTDGSTPDATDNLYSSAVELTKGQTTVKAITILAGYTDSAVATQVFHVDDWDSDTNFESVVIGEYSTDFYAEWSATPSATNIDGPMSFGIENGNGYSDMGPTIRFATDGDIDGINFDTFGAENTLSYSTAKYNFRMWVYPGLSRYTMDAQLDGGSWTRIATDYEFFQPQPSVEDFIWVLETGTSMDIEDLTVTSINRARPGVSRGASAISFLP